jgi:hypothetical protein
LGPGEGVGFRHDRKKKPSSSVEKGFFMDNRTSSSRSKVKTRKDAGED